MQISVHAEALQNDLASVAAVGNVEQTETVQRISAALEASVRLRLLEAITEAAHELTPQLPGHVEVRLAGGDPSLVYVEESEQDWQGGEDEFTARITLRLPGSLKANVEVAASREGLSVNSWLVATIKRGLDRRRQGTRIGSRLTGYARS